MPIDQLRTPLDPSTLAVISVAEPEMEPGKLACEVIDFNRFGNVHLNVRPAHLAAASLDDAPMLRIGNPGSADARRGSTYADFSPGEYGFCSTPVDGSQSSAATLRASEGLGLSLAAPVWLTSPADT